ncbi:MAG: hypothetical protein UHT92_09200 [Prevotella sp.]|nr:hypothetical protein [Prevotella sp.]
MAATNIPRGIRNNNPANIKYAPQNKWQGQAKPNQGFCTFITPIYGLRAAYRLIGSYYTRHNLRTVAQIISRWSPDGKTIEDNYAWYVARGCGILSDEEIDIGNEDFMVKFMKGIVKFENTQNPYDDKTYRKAYRLSGINMYADSVRNK